MSSWRRQRPTVMVRSAGVGRVWVGLTGPGDDGVRDQAQCWRWVLCRGPTDACLHVEPMPVRHRFSVEVGVARRRRPVLGSGFQSERSPHVAVLDSPGCRRISPSPLRNALGAHVIGSTPSPVRQYGSGCVWAV